jgi:hypothetical protein
MNEPPIVIANSSTPTTMHDKVNTIESVMTVLGETLPGFAYLHRKGD